MSEFNNKNNVLTIAGEIVSGFRYSHEIFGEKFYIVDVEVKRKSVNTDILPVMISDRMMDVSKDMTGKLIEVYGQFRSYNQQDEEKNRLILTVFALEAHVIDELPDARTRNEIFLDGFVCRKPTYRETPLGREIADMMLAVNRACGKSDYIPCIIWGRNARHAATFEVGTHVVIGGRVQSREYMKKIDEDVSELRVAYEVSVNRLERVPDDVD